MISNLFENFTGSMSDSDIEPVFLYLVFAVAVCCYSLNLSASVCL